MPVTAFPEVFKAETRCTEQTAKGKENTYADQRSTGERSSVSDGNLQL